jgi:hypothetical protein
MDRELRLECIDLSDESAVFGAGDLVWPVRQIAKRDKTEGLCANANRRRQQYQ